MLPVVRVDKCGSGRAAWVGCTNIDQIDLTQLLSTLFALLCHDSMYCTHMFNVAECS